MAPTVVPLRIKSGVCAICRFRNLRTRRAVPARDSTYVTNDRRSARCLAEAGFEVFAPTYQHFVRRRAFKRLEATPLLPGYVFVRVRDLVDMDKASIILQPPTTREAVSLSRVKIACAVA
jgi:hypothetical protein